MPMSIFCRPRRRRRSCGCPGCGARPDDIQCDADGSICTPYDFCKAGKCEIGKNICTCSDTDECTKFEDGDICNGIMFCNKQAKDPKGNPSPKCEVDPKTVVGCPSVDNTPCKKNLCKPKTGKCEMTFLVKGTPCSDGVPCTDKDQCDNGSCVPGTDICDCQKNADCAPKEDGDVCNGTLFCNKKTLPWKCLVNPASPIKCKTVDNNYCQTNTCHPKTGQCGMVFKHIDEVCDDGDPCTKITICKEGVCKDPEADNVKKCDDGNVCTTDGCDPKKGCVNAANKDKCDDGNACTEGDACVKSKCVSGPKTDCDDKNACTTDICHNIAGCLHIPNSDKCTDGDACTVGDVCGSGKCIKGPANACSDKDPCTVDKCDSKTGKCSHINNGAQACSDGVACTLDTCDPVLGCKHQPQAGPCDDGVPCTTDICILGGGCSHQAVNNACKSQGLCVSIKCDVTKGCVAKPVVDGTGCFDADPCTVGDSCKAGKCASGPKAPLCGVDNKQCEKKKDGTTCNDATACTKGEKCYNQVCRAPVNLANVRVRTWFGSGSKSIYDNQGVRAAVRDPYALAVDGAGNVYLASSYYSVIQRIDLDGISRVVAGAPWPYGKSFADGTGTAARFKNPLGLAMGPKGNLYIADYDNHRIRKMTPEGVVTTFAGQSSYGHVNGKGAEAKFNKPLGLAFDSAGNLFVADHSNHRIRKITPAGQVTTFAGNGSGSYGDGTGTKAKFYHPFAIVIDANDNLFVTESVGHKVRKITPAGVVTTFAGAAKLSAGSTNGKGTVARFNQPTGIAIDHAGILYVADSNNHRIRRILPDGTVSTLVGSTKGYVDGSKSAARFNSPRHVVLDSNGDLLVAEVGNHRVRKVELRRDICSGSGPCDAPTCDTASGKCKAKKICDDHNACSLDSCDAAKSKCTYKNAPTGTGCDDGDPCTVGVQCVRGHCRPNSKVTTFSGGAAAKVDGVAAKARFYYPRGIAFSDDGHLWITDQSNHLIRRWSPDGIVRTVAGSPTEAGMANGKATAARFNAPMGIDVDAAGNAYVADYNNHRVRKITSEGVVTTLAGTGKAGFKNGTGKIAQFYRPKGIAVTDDGIVYVSERDNHRIRRITPDGTTTTFAGSTWGMRDGKGAAARFHQPGGMALDSAGNLIVSDPENNAVRKISPQGDVITLVGISWAGNTDGVGAVGTRLNHPRGVDVDASGNIYIADTDNHSVRMLFPDGTLVTIAGAVNDKGAVVYGTNNGLGSAARFRTPTDIAIGPDGAVYVADHANHRIRKLTPATKLCVDGNACTLDICQRKLGCSNDGAAMICSDGDACTVGDLCTNGKCVAGKKAANCACAGKKCDDGTTCTVDSCDPVKGCANTPVKDGTSCDDGSACTEGERCRAGTCAPNPAKWVVDTWAGGAKGERDGFRVAQAGALATARFAAPSGVDFDPAGGMFIVDLENRLLRRLGTDGFMDTLAGRAYTWQTNVYKDAKATAAGFNYIIDVGTDASGGAYVTEYSAHRIRKYKADGTVTTHAGSGKYGFADGKGAAAKFYNPMGIDCDAIGNCYVADRKNHRIRKVASDGQVTTIAGSTWGFRDGKGSAARFNQPVALALGGDGHLYVTESHNHAVRRVTLDGLVSTVAGGPLAGHVDGYGTFGARFNSPHGVAADKLGNVFVSDRSNHSVRLILSWGETVTIGGKVGGGAKFAEGLTENARFNATYTLDLDAQGHVYVVDQSNNRIRRLRPVGSSCDDGNPCTIDLCDKAKGCSHKPADAAKACPTAGPCVQPTCDVKAAKCTYKARPNGWVCGGTGDCNKQCIGGSCVTAAVTWNYAGAGYGKTDGPADKAKFYSPWGLAIDKKDTLYVADRYNHRIRKITADGTVSTLAGSGAGYAEGVGVKAKFNQPLGLDLAPDGTLYVADYINNRIRKVNAAGKVSTLAGSTGGYKEGVGSLAKLNHPVGVCFDGKDGVYFTDTNNHRIRHVAANGTTKLIAGSGSKNIVDGSKTAAAFAYPHDLLLDGKGGLIVADGESSAIRRINLADGSVATLVGSDRTWNKNAYYNGKGRLGTSFWVPVGLALMPDGSLLVTDTNHHTLRRVWLDGSSETLAGVTAKGYVHGIGADVRLNLPRELVIDSKGDILVADDGNHRIRKFSTKLNKCSHLTGIHQYTAGKSCKSIKPQYKWGNITTFWVDPDGGDKANAIKTTCDMKSDGGGWTRVDQDTKVEDIQLMLGSKGRMMLKCSDGGVEHLVSPATSKTWAWSNKKHAVAGDWIVKAKDGNAKTVKCGADPAFDELECGWGFGCSDGKDDPKKKLVTNKVMPGVKSTVQCTNTTTVQTGMDMSICGSDAYNKYRVFVRSDD